MKLIGVNKWRKGAQSVKDNEQPNACHKILQPTIKRVDGQERTIRFIISTNAIDRDGDTINVDGWELERYRANPVVLWAHDSAALPVGNATAIGVQTSDRKQSLVADTVFTDRDTYEFGYTVYQLYDKGFLHATSVGFMPKTWQWREDDDSPAGIDFLTQELLEYSTVPVPSNPEALIQARSAGIDTEPLVEWAEKVLEGEEQPSIFIPKKLLERVRKAAQGKSPVTFHLSNEAQSNLLAENLRRIREQKAQDEASAETADTGGVTEGNEEETADLMVGWEMEDSSSTTTEGEADDGIELDEASEESEDTPPIEEPDGSSTEDDSTPPESTDEPELPLELNYEIPSIKFYFDGMEFAEIPGPFAFTPEDPNLELVVQDKIAQRVMGGESFTFNAIQTDNGFDFKRPTGLPTDITWGIPSTTTFPNTVGGQLTTGTTSQPAKSGKEQLVLKVDTSEVKEFFDELKSLILKQAERIEELEQRLAPQNQDDEELTIETSDESYELDDSDPSNEDTFPMDQEEFRSLIRDTISKKMRSITGRID